MPKAKIELHDMDHGHCKYFFFLLQVTNVDDKTMHVDGPPATCANLALHSLVPDVDFVISGPNVGHNVGRYTALSTTFSWAQSLHLCRHCIVEWCLLADETEAGFCSALCY